MGAAGTDAAAADRGFELVGRRRELDLLLAELDMPPAVVLVEGEAGVGKSRLVQEAAAVLGGRGVRVLTGWCHPLREPLPFGPVLDALRGIGDRLPGPGGLSPQAGALAPLLPGLAERLPPVPEAPPDARAGRFQLVGAVRSVLEALGPVVLVVEDLHWVDEATRELLLLLGRDPPRQLGLVLTYRREDLPAGAPVLGMPYRRPTGTSGAEIRLRELTEADVQDLAGAALGPRASAGLGRALYQRSGGLPLIVEEDLLTLAGRNPSAPSTAPGSGRRTGAEPLAKTSDVAVLEQSEVPRQLREAVTGRMAGLSASGTAVVQAAAVLAVPAGQDLLTEVAGLDPGQGTGALLEALQAAVLREDGPARYGLRHTLARQVVYEDIPGPRREQLHRQAVQVLRSEPAPPLVQIAHHTRALGDVEEWLRQAEAAADQAIAMGDEGTATTLIHDILAQPRLPGDLRTRAALALARIAIHAVDYTTSADALRRILADPRLPASARGEVRLALGRLIVNHAQDAAGLREIERAAEELADRPELAARAMGILAMGERYQSAQQAVAWMDRAVRTVRDSPDQAAQAYVRAAHISLLHRMGDPAGWRMADELPRHGAAPEALDQNYRALLNVGIHAIDMGHDQRAAALLHECLDNARHLGNSVRECFARSNFLQLDWLAGRWDRLEEAFSRLNEEFPEMATAAAEGLLIGGSLAAARGQWAAALDRLGRAADIGRSSLFVPWEFRAVAGIAGVQLARGMPQDAWATVAPAVETLCRTETWLRSVGLVPVAVRAALACGHRELADDLATRLEHGLRGIDAPAVAADLYTALGLIRQDDGDTPGAAEHFTRASVTLRDIGRPYSTVQATEHAARALAKTAPRDAAGCYTDAEAVYVRLGATADAARVQRALRELGSARPGLNRRRAYGEELSPRESQVAQLLAHGATNKDIAQALSLSIRTVEHHVARVLKKLHTTRDNIPAAGGNTR